MDRRRARWASGPVASYASQGMDHGGAASTALAGESEPDSTGEAVAALAGAVSATSA
ncbi:hypothetical protein [Dactylosporangium sp. CA-233914]|uniref:hypothetical protein n=1 Tax=Dactylosporangium sp. CA-233914 TaxID=3239934 RepID=UPI003D8FB0B8